MVDYGGGGAFAAPVGHTVGPEPWGATATDLNGDTYPDVAVVIHDADNFAVFLNNGDGARSYSGAYPAGGAHIAPAYLMSGNFNDDEYPDIPVTKDYHNLCFAEGYVQIYFNDGAGGFTFVQTITTGPTATTPIAADFDGDEGVYSGSFSVILNHAVARFQLSLNRPNPCKSDTVIRYAMTEAAQIRLDANGINRQREMILAR